MMVMIPQEVNNVHGRTDDVEIPSDIAKGETGKEFVKTLKHII
jgi:hypothetical protein